MTTALTMKDYRTSLLHYFREEFSEDMIARMIDAAEQVEQEYTCEVYDAISDASDYYVPIWDVDVLDAARYLDKKAGEVLRDGLVDLSPEKFSIVTLLRVAYYELISEALFGILPDILYNHMAGVINDSRRLTEDVDVDALEDALQATAEKISSDAQFDEIDEAAALELASALGENVAEIENPLKLLTKPEN